MHDRQENSPVSPMFAERVRQALARQGRKSISALAEATGISRHTLKKIAEGGDARLWLSQLTQFDEHLGAEYGLGLIAKDSLLTALAKQSASTFLLPGYQQNFRNWTSTWDVMASSHIRSQIEGVSPDHRFAMVSVEQHATAESIMSQLTDVNVICIGSPRAFDISSYLLDRLFFPPGEDAQREPPFRFFWATRAPQTRFTIAPEDATLKALRQEIDEMQSNAAWAITIGDQAYLSKRNVSHGVSRFRGYGIAAATWVRGFVHAVYAGLSGPDSEALGKCTRELSNFAGRPPHDDGSSPVVWYLVESVIEGPETPQPEQGDLRKLVDQKVISGPHYWMRKV